MRISQRGQVTIPQHIREQCGLLPNSEVEFVIRDGVVQLIPEAKQRRSKVRALYGKKKLAMTTDEIMRLLRG